MKRIVKKASPIIFLFIAVLGIAFFTDEIKRDQVEVTRVPLSTFVEHLQNEDISEINVTDTKLTGKLNEKKVVYTYVNSVVELSMINEMYLNM